MRGGGENKTLSMSANCDVLERLNINIVNAIRTLNNNNNNIPTAIKVNVNSRLQIHRYDRIHRDENDAFRGR